MAKRSGVNSIPFWGSFATAAQLPNVSGATLQSVQVDAGDQAYVSGTAAFYVCTTATVGAAVWARVGPGQTLSTVFNASGDLSFAVLGAAAGTVSLSALIDGTRSVALDGVITSVILNQQGDGTAGTTTAELYRRRAGAFTLLATISLAQGGGDYSQTAAVPAGALATITAGDRWYVQLIAAQTDGLNASLEVQFGAT